MKWSPRGKQWPDRQTRWSLHHGCFVASGSILYQRSDEIWRLSRHFRATYVTERAVFEVKVFESFAAAQWQKAQIHTAGENLKERRWMLASSEPSLKLPGKSLVKAETCHCTQKELLQTLKSFKPQQWKSGRARYFQQRRCEGAFKEHLESVLKAEGAGAKNYWRVSASYCVLCTFCVHIISLEKCFFYYLAQ